MSLKVSIDLSGLTSEQVGEVLEAWENRAPLNEKVAGAAELFVKTKGKDKAKITHDTANRLGAKPSGHLAEQYEAIAAESDSAGAYLLVPSAGRLRAAFGAYSLHSPTPSGKTYYTIPVNADAYDRRAGEFTDLLPLRVGPKQTPILARDLGGGRLETMYLLVKDIDVKEDESLIPWDELHNECSLVAEDWFLKTADEILADKAA